MGTIGRNRITGCTSQRLGSHTLRRCKRRRRKRCPLGNLIDPAFSLRSSGSRFILEPRLIDSASPWSSWRTGRSGAYRRHPRRVGQQECHFLGHRARCWTSLGLMSESAWTRFPMSRNNSSNTSSSARDMVAPSFSISCSTRKGLRFLASLRLVGTKVRDISHTEYRAFRGRSMTRASAPGSMWWTTRERRSGPWINCSHLHSAHLQQSMREFVSSWSQSHCANR